MKPVSPKQAKRLAVFARMKREFLGDFPMCSGYRFTHTGETYRCYYNAVDVHHKRGRVGELLTDREHFVGLCRQCHQYVGEHPAWAYSVGLSERRVGAP